MASGVSVVGIELLQPEDRAGLTAVPRRFSVVRTATHMTRIHVAWIVSVPSVIWFFHDVAIAAAKKPVGWFPIVPASITATAVMLALYWMSQEREG
jgi:hypothetical protein